MTDPTSAADALEKAKDLLCDYIAADRTVRIDYDHHPAVIAIKDAIARAAAPQEVDARIIAAKKRLCDAKAIHSNWMMMPKYQADTYAAENMNAIEQIVYSAICYLDGVDGPYLQEAQRNLIGNAQGRG